MKYKIVLFLLLAFSLNTINCQEISLEKYLNDLCENRVLFGIIDYYKGLLFDEKYIDNEWQDQYSEVFFIIPMGSLRGLCVQGDGKNILDIFYFIYNIETNEFDIQYEEISILLKVHREAVLQEIVRTRFKLNTKEVIRYTLIQYE